jgi:hypothetical protein
MGGSFAAIQAQGAAPGQGSEAPHIGRARGLSSFAEGGMRRTLFCKGLKEKEVFEGSQTAKKILHRTLLANGLPDHIVLNTKR